jgi:hypothetical protein
VAVASQTQWLVAQIRHEPLPCLRHTAHQGHNPTGSLGGLTWQGMTSRETPVVAGGPVSMEVVALSKEEPKPSHQPPPLSGRVASMCARVEGLVEGCGGGVRATDLVAILVGRSCGRRS